MRRRMDNKEDGDHKNGQRRGQTRTMKMRETSARQLPPTNTRDSHNEDEEPTTPNECRDDPTNTTTTPTGLPPT
jgi:hypothetical protein